MKVLSLSDIVIPFIYSPQIAERFTDVDIGIGCGDLPYYYQEYVISKLDVPFFFVRGNHSKEEEQTTSGVFNAPQGATDLHRQVLNYKGLLMAGVEGSGRYREGSFQYTQTEMWLHIAHLVPGLLRNQAAKGRFLDVFVSHAPPWGIHDQEDLPHQGIKAFRWFLTIFKPAYHFHGHIHVYRPDTPVETHFHHTKVINSFGFKETEVEPGAREGLNQFHHPRGGD